MAKRAIIQSSKVPDGDAAFEKILRKSTDRIEEFDHKLQNVITDLTDTMNAQSPLCVGLAAPQIGESIRVAAIHRDDQPDLILVNPEIISQTGKKDKKRESCMSLWGVMGPVTRRDKVKIKYQDENGEHHEAEFTGFFGRVVQHEVDHLNGVLYCDLVDGELMSTEIFNEYSPEP